VNAMAMAMTLKRYYSSFKSLSGILAGLLASLPFSSQLLPNGAYLFPPLGDIEGPARAGVLVLAFATTYAVYFLVKGSSLNQNIAVGLLVIIALFGLVAYLALAEEFVRHIDIPSRGTRIYITIGYERTAFAKSNFDSAPDEELLRARGMDEEQMRMLWTPRSLTITRVALFAAYSFVVLSLVAALSFGVASEIPRR
jgi:hypothetical protein